MTELRENRWERTNVIDENDLTMHRIQLINPDEDCDVVFFYFYAQPDPIEQLALGRESAGAG